VENLAQHDERDTHRASAFRRVGGCGRCWAVHDEAESFSLSRGNESGKTACPILFPRVMTWIMFHRKFLLPLSPPVAKMSPAPFCIDFFSSSKIILNPCFFVKSCHSQQNFTPQKSEFLP
jgi:hypothetical protein